MSKDGERPKVSLGWGQSFHFARLYKGMYHKNGHVRDKTHVVVIRGHVRRKYQTTRSIFSTQTWIEQGNASLGKKGERKKVMSS